MCRLAWQLLGMLGNVLRHPRHALQRLRSPTSKKNPPTYCLISCEAKGVVYHQASIYETQWYTTPLVSRLIRQQVEGFFFDVGLLGPAKMHAEDVLMWESKMCRHAWQLLGMLGNVLGRPQHALQRPRHACNVLGMLATSLAELGMLLQGPRSPTSTPPYLLPYKL